MKRFLLIVALSLLIPLAEMKAATVTNFIVDGFNNPINTRVIVTPFVPSTVFGNTNVLGPSAGFQCTNGFWTINFLGGFYYVDQGLGQPIVIGYVAPGDTNTYSLAQFTSMATNPIPSFFVSGSGVLYVTNVISLVSTIYVTNIFSTNITFVQSSPLTNNWGGPTNVLDLSFQDQEYSSFTSMAITGVINKGSNTVNTTTLSLLNLSGTNETLTLDTHIETREGIRQYTITNGQDFIISIRYHPATIRTNAVTAIQF